MDLDAKIWAAIIAAMTSLVGAGITWFQVRNVFSYKASIKFLERRIDTLSTYFETDFFLENFNQPRPRQTLEVLDTTEIERIFGELQGYHFRRLRFFLKNQANFSKKNSVRLHKIYQVIINLPEFSNDPKKADFIDKILPLSEFAYLLQKTINDELLEASAKLNKNKKDNYI